MPGKDAVPVDIILPTINGDETLERLIPKLVFVIWFCCITTCDRLETEIPHPELFMLQYLISEEVVYLAGLRFVAQVL